MTPLLILRGSIVVLLLLVARLNLNALLAGPLLALLPPRAGGAAGAIFHRSCFDLSHRCASSPNDQKPRSK